MKLTGCGLWLLVTASGALQAQRMPTGLDRNARIRVLAPDAGVSMRTTAVLDSLSADSLIVHALRDPVAMRGVARVAVPLGMIRSLDVSTGRASRLAHARRGALWALGGYALLATAYLVHESAYCDGSECYGEGMAFIGLPIGAAWAAGTGAVIGAALSVERWRRVLPR